MYTKMGRKEKGFLSTIAVCDILVLFLILANILSKERTGISLAWNMILAGSFLGVQAAGAALYIFQERQTLRNLSELLLLVGTALYNLAVTEMAGGVQYNLSSAGVFVLNFLVIFIIVVISYRVTGRIWATALFTNTLFLILGLVNHYYFEFRGEPFELANLAAADTALEVVGQYRFKVDETLILLLVTELVFCFMVFGVLRRCRGRISVLPRCLTEVAALCGGVYLALHAPELSFFSIQGACEENGYLYLFLFYYKEMNAVLEPEFYDVERAEKILESYRREEKSKRTPDIIVVMNESFSDLPSIYGFETNEDIMPYIHSMSEDTIKGNLLVSSYGGSTVNTEYEFLTGNSMAFMKRNSYPYTQYIRREQQSLASMLRSRGYEVTGYHPYFSSAYSRKRIYPFLGINDFYTIEDTLPSNEYIRWCLSDQSDYENLIYLYEKSRLENNDAPVFLFNVTMQNHGDYGKEDFGFEASIKAKDEKLQSPQMNEYLSLIRESDSAFEQLVKHFTQLDRDVIILMFGDHQPGIESEMYKVMAAELFSENAANEIKQRQYLTDFVIWANFDIEEKDNELISSNYLRTLLLQTAECGMSCYDRFLLEIREEYPAINALGYCDREGNWYNMKELNDSLKSYSCLQYYNAFDHENLNISYFE